jgi:hypothetical protein
MFSETTDWKWDAKRKVLLAFGCGLSVAMLEASRTDELSLG